MKGNSSMRFRLIVLLSLIILSSPGCVSGESTTIPTNPVPISPSFQPEGENVYDLAASINDFGFTLLQNLKDEEGNLVLSPFSLSQSMIMVYAGARGETADQMRQVLGFKLDQTRLHPAMASLNTRVMRIRDGETHPGNREPIKIANSLWADISCTYDSSFLGLMENNYQAGIEQVDFIDPGNREAARQEINKWVLDQTNQKIEEFIPPGLLNKYSRLVLVNAITFSADWKIPFNSTEEALFQRQDGKMIYVPMMELTAYMDYLSGSNFQAVSLEYGDSDIETIFILPDEGQLYDVVEQLNNQMINELLENRQTEVVELYLPRFSSQARFDKLPDILKSLGMVNAFNTDLADFSGMISCPLPVAIGAVFHEATITIDESGTEAEAASGIEIEEEIEADAPVDTHIVLRFDRPFLVVIRQRDTGAILFLALILDPS